MAKTAIILGITGLTGSILAKQLVEDDYYDRIVSFHHRKSGLTHPKLTEHVIDMQKLVEAEEDFNADVVFCCVGTTRHQTPNKDEYKSIDYGIPITAASLCKKNSIPVLIAISAIGADVSSRIFYTRLKGEMERDILDLGIKNTYFMQPSLLKGNRVEYRPEEKFAAYVFKIVNPLLVGPLKKYRSIRAAKVATAMRMVAIMGYSKPCIPSEEIKAITA